MTNEDKIKAILNLLEEYQDSEVAYYEDDFNAYDYCAGNVDDAWTGGMADGRTDLAQDILSILSKNQ